jgi:hypothetical protein
MVEQHYHNGVDSPKIINTHLRTAYKDSEVVLLTTDQTIAGVKTFSSIPVLPESDPTTDNQAVRKAYADSQLPATELIASSTVRDSADTERYTDQTTYTKLKDITVNADSGTVTVDFDAKIGGAASGTCYFRIYKNGTAAGTERTETDGTYTTYSEDIDVTAGDEVQLCAKKDVGSDNAYVQNFRLKYDRVLSITEGTVNTN